MGISYITIVGLRLDHDKLLEEKNIEKTVTKYNPDTGVPYEKKEIETVLEYKGSLTEKTYDDIIYSDDFYSDAEEFIYIINSVEPGYGIEIEDNAKEVALAELNDLLSPYDIKFTADEVELTVYFAVM